MSTAKARQQARRRRNKALSAALTLVLLVVITAVYLRHHTVAVLQPVGPVASGEKHLLVIAFLLMLLIVIPVFGLTFWFAWHYRETNKATYKPNFDHSKLFETIWWLVPTALITVLAVLTWRGTHTYDPYRAIASSQPPLVVQVVAEPGWWLFMYPEQGVASVNQLHLPVNRPVEFEITADAPMNSFWIPQLGGQIYAMPGMVSQLHLLASKTGSYYGSSANISGPRFADMHFKATVTDRSAFDHWAGLASGASCLDADSYDDLHRTGTTNSMWRLDPQMFSQIVGRYNMGHEHMDALATGPQNTTTMEACFG